MSYMLYNLPPLAPDYSGVASVFHDLGTLTIIHDASGCTGTYTGYDEPRWFGSSSPTFSSGLREMDAIMGDDEKLLEKIRRALEDTRAPSVTIIGSPVPMVIGFDFKGFASLVESRTGLPSFGFPATGLAYYDQGQKEAYLAIAKKLLSGNPPRDRKSVNILGASAQDGFDDAALDALEALLESAGLKERTIWGARSSQEELKDSGGAGVNWVITAAAL
ncbi:MAG: nitrogenase component 1, partial [Treponema sp.]|nr:nitrogenase component 1 [Treponema sp.]